MQTNGHDVRQNWPQREVLHDNHEVYRGRSPEIIRPVFKALLRHRSVFSLLLPNKKTIGLPYWPDADAQRVAIIDDLDVTAARPSSFDNQTLEWWAARVDIFAVDATNPPRQRFQETLAGLASDEYLLLIVQTPESRRQVWHHYFVQVCTPNTPAFVIDHMNSKVPGAPANRLCAGRLGVEFPADAPFKSIPDLSCPAITRYQMRSNRADGLDL
jgi:hypothetical protein